MAASYLPASHPLSHRAEYILQQLLAAATALLSERHGAQSPVFLRHQQHFEGYQIPVRVFQVEGKSRIAGFADVGPFMAARDDHVTPYILAHELAHAICRHDYEEAHSLANYKWSSTGLGCGSLLLRSLVDWWRLPLRHGCILAVGQGCFNILHNHSGPRSTDALKSWSWAQLHGSWAQLLPIAVERNAAGLEAASEAGSSAFLRPGQLGFDAAGSISRAINAELEAERLALLIMARWGCMQGCTFSCQVLSLTSYSSLTLCPVQGREEPAHSSCTALRLTLDATCPDKTYCRFPL